jgi:Protein of unknown function (DUF2568)
VSPVRAVLLLVAFLLELAVLLAVGYFGFHRSGPLAWLLGLGLPLLFAVLWGVFAAPHAVRPLHGAVDAAFRIAWFACGAGALALAGQPVAGVALAVVWVVNSLSLLATGG